MARRIVQGDLDMVKPGAEAKDVSVLFCDIAGYTRLCTKVGDDNLPEVMGAYFDTITNCVLETEGIVIKFIGDKVFTAWGAPQAQPNHPELACRAAMRMVEVQPTLTAMAAKHGAEIRLRIGANCGVANVGNFGSSRRVDYTILGAVVNYANALNGLNSTFGTNCLISGDMEERVRGKFVTRQIDLFMVKGQDGNGSAHELVGTMENADETRPWRDAFAEARQKYVERDWVGATAGFNEVLKLKPGDGPALVHLQRIEDWQRSPPGVREAEAETNGRV